MQSRYGDTLAVASLSNTPPGEFQYPRIYFLKKMRINNISENVITNYLMANASMDELINPFGTDPIDTNAFEFEVEKTDEEKEDDVKEKEISEDEPKEENDEDA